MLDVQGVGGRPTLRNGRGGKRTGGGTEFYRRVQSGSWGSNSFGKWGGETLRKREGKFNLGYDLGRVGGGLRDRVGGSPDRARSFPGKRDKSIGDFLQGIEAKKRGGASVQVESKREKSSKRSRKTRTQKLVA